MLNACKTILFNAPMTRPSLWRAAVIIQCIVQGRCSVEAGWEHTTSKNCRLGVWFRSLCMAALWVLRFQFFPNNNQHPTGIEPKSTIKDHNNALPTHLQCCFLICIICCFNKRRNFSFQTLREQFLKTDKSMM